MGKKLEDGISVTVSLQPTSLASLAYLSTNTLGFYEAVKKGQREGRTKSLVWLVGCQLGVTFSVNASSKLCAWFVDEEKAWSFHICSWVVFGLWVCTLMCCVLPSHSIKNFKLKSPGGTVAWCSPVDVLWGHQEWARRAESRTLPSSLPLDTGGPTSCSNLSKGFRNLHEISQILSISH